MTAITWAIIGLFLWMWSHQLQHGYVNTGQRWLLRLSALVAVLGVASLVLAGLQLIGLL